MASSLGDFDLGSRVRVLDVAHADGELTNVVIDPRQQFLDNAPSRGADVQEFAKLMQGKKTGGEQCNINRTLGCFVMWANDCQIRCQVEVRC